MLAEAIRTFYDYGRWATARILDTAEALTQEQFHAPGNAGRGSVRDTLLHMIGTQQGWLNWWDGSLPAQEAYSQRPDPADFPDLKSLRAAWESLEEQTRAFVTGLSDDDVVKNYEQTLPNGDNWSMPLWQMMAHVANHGTQHRSEIAAMFTGFGHSPGDLDLLNYFASRGSGNGA